MARFARSGASNEQSNDAHCVPGVLLPGGRHQRHPGASDVIAAHTYDIIINYHDGVLSVSKWLLIIIVLALLRVGTSN